MTIRKRVIGSVLVVIGLPLLLALTAVVSFYVSFYDMDRATGTIVSSGQEREYLLHVPPSYDPTRPTPLVISLHAAMLWPATQMRTSRWNEVADEHGFMVVYPSGRELSGGGTGVLPKAWFMSAEVVQMRDVRFIADLIDTLQATYNIDPKRIYANGLSLGGGMAFALSCRLSHRIAAVGAVAAAQTLPWSWCGDSRPVPKTPRRVPAVRAMGYPVWGREIVAGRGPAQSLRVVAGWRKRVGIEPTKKKK